MDLRDSKTERKGFRVNEKIFNAVHPVAEKFQKTVRQNLDRLSGRQRNAILFALAGGLLVMNFILLHHLFSKNELKKSILIQPIVMPWHIGRNKDYRAVMTDSERQMTIKGVDSMRKLFDSLNKPKK